MREINRGIIHCSATRPSDDIDIQDIKYLHKLPEGMWTDWAGKQVEGKGFRDVGYHFFIKRDGTTQYGRPIYVQGAGVKGENEDSIHVCMAGGVNEDGEPDCNYTKDQWHSLECLMGRKDKAYGITFYQLDWYGHRDFANKACPCFDVRSWV